MVSPSKTLPPRVGRWAQAIKDAGLSVGVAFKPENVFHLTGFNPVIQSLPLPVIVYADGRAPTFLVNELRDERAREQSWITDIRVCGNFYRSDGYAKDWLDGIKRVLEELGLTGGKIGLDLAGLTSEQYLEQVMPALPTVELVNISGVARDIRLVKDADEIANARIAGDLADVGMDAARAAIAKGGSEQQVVVAAQAAMNAHWVANYPDVDIAGFGSNEAGQHNGLDCWALTGDRTRRFTDTPRALKLQPGELFAVLIWTVANGMHVEKEATFFMGAIGNELAGKIRHTLGAHEAALTMLKPGQPLRKVHGAAWNYLLENGADVRYPPGRIGHSIGLGSHEDQSISAKSEVVARSGMIVAVEPDDYIPDGSRPVFSQTFLITADGYEPITKPIELKDVRVQEERNVLPCRYWSMEDMKKVGVEITPEVVMEATKEVWKALADGKKPGLKTVIDFPPEEQISGFPKFAALEEKYRDQAHNSTLAATSQGMLVKKLLVALPANRKVVDDDGNPLQRSTSTITAVDKYTGRPVGVLDGTLISHARTAVYVSKVVELYYPDRQGIRVFIFAAGPVVEQIVLLIAYLEMLDPGKFAEVVIKSTGRSSLDLVAKLKGRVGGLNLSATNSKALLKGSDLVVTVTGSDEALFKLQELKADAVTISLGIEKYGDEILWQSLEQGGAAVDHIALVGKRGVDLLPKLYKENERDFLEEAEADGVQSLFNMKPLFKREGAGHVEAVGLPILDAYVTEHVLGQLAEKQGYELGLFDADVHELLEK
jgi:Xaa-Pro dipeptidase